MKLDYIYKFNSVKEVCDFIENTPNNKIDKCNSSELGSERFTGTKSLNEALHLLKYGDASLLKQIKATGSTTKQAKAQRRSSMEVYNSYLGFMPNVGAVLTGNPVNMYNIRRTLTKSTKVLNIIYDISTDARTPARNIQEAASKLFNYIQDKELKGYRVNLYVCLIAYYSSTAKGYKTGKTGLFCYKIKSSNEHFDALRTAFPLCHPSSLRRIFFALYERSDAPTQGNYGSPICQEFDSETASNIVASQFPNYNYYNIETIDSAK